MRLLIDTDIFCKLAVGRLLHEAVGLFGTKLQECARLPALPNMLSRGKELRKTYGADACDGLVPLAREILNTVEAGAEALDRFTGTPNIDPGEAIIFASATESGLMVMSGDKRALEALKGIPDACDALAGKIVVLEAVLIKLCDQLGPDVVRERTVELAKIDKVTGNCFSKDNPNPKEALLTYYRSLCERVKPLVLWNPTAGGPE